MQVILKEFKEFKKYLTFEKVLLKLCRSFEVEFPWYFFESGLATFHLDHKKFI
jgi:hypothetical protein